MRQPIDTAPKDGEDLWVESATGALDIARWSSEAGQWICKDGRPISITPTHWHPITDDVLVDDEQPSGWLTIGRAGRIAACLMAVGLVAAAAIMVLDGEREVAETARAGDSAGLDPAAETASAQQTSLQQDPTLPMQDATAPPQPPAAAPPRPAPEEESTRVDELATSTELRQSLQQEREKSAALATDLAKSRGDLEATVTLSSKLQDDAVQRWQAAEVAAEELRQSLQQERTRTAALADELTGTRRQIETRNARSRETDDAVAQEKQAAGQQIADLRQSLQQEQDKNAALSREAGAARQALTASAEQQRAALEEAQKRAAALASELAGARSEFESEAAKSKKVVDEAAQQKQATEVVVAKLRQSLRRERDKSAALVKDAETARAQLPSAEQTEQQRAALEEAQTRAAALASELAGARRELESEAAKSKQAIVEAAQQKQATEVVIAKLRQSLRRERDKSAAVVKEAETTRAQLPSAEQTERADQQRRTLEEMQARATALADELAGTRRELESRDAALRKANDAAAQQGQAAEREIADLRLTLQQERSKTEAMAQELASTRRAAAEPALLARAIESPVVTATPPPTQAPAAAVPEPATTPEQDKAEAARLIARASALLGQGNIGAARTVLERAAANDNARASFMLAETYDPVVLSAWGTHGTRGEAVKARELYAKAHSGGIREAKDRLDALSR